MDLTLATVVGLVVLGIFAGWLGAVVGIGGGIVVVPALTLGFGFDIRTALATSLIAVVATSVTASATFVGRGTSNLRLGMTLLIATTIGGIVGGSIAVVIAPSVLAGLFAVVMLTTAFVVGRNKSGEHVELETSTVCAAPRNEGQEANALAIRGWEDAGTLGGAYFDDHAGGFVHYQAQRVRLGAAISLGAGVVSGLLGVGGGFINVPTMAEGMRVPFKVATATSTFMVGATAVASLFVYLANGYVEPYAAVPVALGVVGGASLGAATAAKVSAQLLRQILVAILVLVAIQMALKAFGVNFGR